MLFDWKMENSREQIEKLGLVGATGQWRDAVVSKAEAGGGSSHENRDASRKNIAKGARPTEQTGSVWRK